MSRIPADSGISWTELATPSGWRLTDSLRHVEGFSQSDGAAVQHVCSQFRHRGSRHRNRMPRQVEGRAAWHAQHSSHGAARSQLRPQFLSYSGT